MKRLVLLMLLCSVTGILYAQEICDNALDDDGDGLIDLNDPDCACHGIDIGLSSLIPNHSFEDTVCCPDNFTQMNCATSWVQASVATSDYLNTCGFMGDWSIGGFVDLPLPGGGSGCAGFYVLNNYPGSLGNYREYIGTCLDSPLVVGGDYHLSIYINPSMVTRDTFILSIYGTPNCTDLPWDTETCPLGNGDWVLLGSAAVTYTDDQPWQRVSVRLNPSTDIYAIAIGGPCADPNDAQPTFEYFFIDELSLVDITEYGMITESGNLCNKNLLLTAEVNAQGGTWQWYHDGIALAGENAATLDLMPYGVSGTYSVVYALDGACIAFDHIVDSSFENSLYVMEILNKDTIVCSGTIIPVRAEGTDGFTYQWSPTVGVSDPHALTPDISTLGDTSILYTLTASYRGCPDTSQSFFVEVDSRNQPSYKAEPDAVCVGQPVHLSPRNLGAHLEMLQWQFSGNEREEQKRQAIYQHAFDEAGTYPITLYSTFRACPDTSYTDSIRVYALPEVDLGGDTSICPDGAPINLRNARPAPSDSYHEVWSTGDTTEVLKVVHPGIYTLSVTTEPLGCTTTESVEIGKDCYIDIPNAFTPNGDGFNDYFFPRQLLGQSISRFHMQVFNRWGQIVFETKQLDGRGWDGHLNEKPQPTGVYLYRIDVGFSNGMEEKQEGNVTLLR